MKPFEEIEIIRKIVFDYFKIDDRYSDECRKGNYVKARQLVLYFCKKNTMYSLANIGEKSFGKDHTTVLHAIKNVNNFCETDKYYLGIFNELDKKISCQLLYLNNRLKNIDLIRKIILLKKEQCEKIRLQIIKDLVREFAI